MFCMQNVHNSTGLPVEVSMMMMDMYEVLFHLLCKNRRAIETAKFGKGYFRHSDQLFTWKKH